MAVSSVAGLCRRQSGPTLSRALVSLGRRRLTGRFVAVTEYLTTCGVGTPIKPGGPRHFRIRVQLRSTASGPIYAIGEWPASAGDSGLSSQRILLQRDQCNVYALSHPHG